ncbi:MAG: ribbon-helix-helix domain-containing protein [Salibacteraceae bacterium]|jgi:predicted transcriptional regulator|nr:ribbon-helix-helix domain-containing protein [Salibacteraceae bacterium]MDP4685271.1 ribbon-helix-helix domain-containing protein [Salibacteraceae bacterium]MDP4762547.1 ribbon-helix-helix domain-containing protein [Salibacteraceae bacterium]MDP4844215.1 ribbon-helix-helix domain-containing protein [Salibacteraceae bacterium]MDP4934058.1 ribbon-helix-helix domain-containing protein [Salibacteraceae bacterium]
MSTFTSTLPDQLLEKLSQKAKELKLPKNKLIEKALEIYLDQLNKAEYIKSFKAAAEDEDIMTIAEEGMAEYFTQISEDEAG